MPTVTATPRRPRQQVVRYQPPVTAPVSDPFRPPARRWGPGNRGIEYATSPGGAVGASADGTVVFAGPVAGARHVTLRHADGVRTSYSLLATVDVVRGQRVRRGETIGTSGPRLHLGARIGDVYVDPATLFAGEVRVELMPYEIPPGSTPADEAAALVDLVFGERWSSPVIGDVAGWLRDRAATALDYAAQLDLGTRGPAVLAELATRLLAPGECSVGPAPSRPAGGGARRVAVTVGGLGSSGATAAVDDLRTDELGYAPGDVVRFSYRGGRVPGTGTGLEAPATSDYVPADTGDDPRVAAARLADLVEQALADDPPATVDVYAHSLGGVVARLAIVELQARGVDLGRLGLVATLGSPHRGADLATAATAVAGTVTGGAALEEAADLLDTGVRADAAAVRQLAEGSDVVALLEDAGPPPGVDLVSIAARGDLVVAAPRTEVDGGVNVTVPVSGTTAHSALVGSDAATRELGLALAGLPPGCESWTDVVGDVLVGEGISLAEDALGATASSLP